MPKRGRPAGPVRRQERGELVIRRPGEGFWREDFYVQGHRFRGSLGTDSKAEAEALAAASRAEKLKAALVETARPAGNSNSAANRRAVRELTVSQAEARYLVEIGQYARTSDDIKRMGQIIVTGLGAATRLADVSFGQLSAFIATRRMRRTKNQRELVYRANGSINREIGHFRTVMLQAKRWGVPVPDLDWRRLMLDEPDNVQTILSAEAEPALFAELRPDYHALVRAAIITGRRLDELLTLRWKQIDWQARTITLRTKSRKPGGKLLIAPLTDELVAILGRERGHNFEFVFTYEANRSRHDRHTGKVQVKGERYPFSHDGWRKEWDRARRAIGLPQLRFHDLRHTAATRLLAASGNIKTVQRALGHADISTTLRYLASDTEDVRAAMEKVAKAAGQRMRIAGDKGD